MGGGYLGCSWHLKCREEAARNDGAELFRFAANADFRVGYLLRFPHSVHGEAPGYGIDEGVVIRLEFLVLQPIWPLRGIAVRGKLKPFWRAPYGIPGFLRFIEFGFEFFRFLIGDRWHFTRKFDQHRWVVIIEPATAHLVPNARTVIGAGEDPGQGVVIRCRNRIELVIV